MTRTAISPRLATSTLENIAGSLEAGARVRVPALPNPVSEALRRVRHRPRSTRPCHIALALVALQFLFAGLGLFGAGPFEIHFIVGTLVQLLALITLVVSLISKRARGWSAGLAVAAVLQGFLPAFRESVPLLAALHVVNPLLILYLGLAALNGGPPSLGTGDRNGEASAARPLAAVRSERVGWSRAGSRRDTVDAARPRGG